jgi:hypothetical protein
MRTKNYIDPYALADHCEEYIISEIRSVLYNQIDEINPEYWHDSDEDEVVNHAFAYLITKLYKYETNNYDGKN